jgi:hypothetical protein
MLAIIRVKVRRDVIVEIHADNYPEEAADFWQTKLYAKYLAHSLADFQFPILTWDDFLFVQPRASQGADA